MKTKRVFALLIALVMCVSLVLSSCDKLKKKDIEEDPVGKVAEGARASAEVLSSGLTPLDPIIAAKDKGVVSFTFDNGELGVKVEGKNAYDVAAKRFSGDYSLSAEDVDLSLGVDVSKTEIAVSVPELSDKTYGVDLTTLAEKIRDSGLAKVLDLDDDAIEAIESATAYLTGDGAATLVSAYDKIKSDLKARVNEAEHTVEKKEVTVGGETVKAYEVIFKLTKTDISDLLGIVKTDAKLFEGVLDTLGKYAILPVEDGDGSVIDALCDQIDDARTELAKDGNDASAVLTFNLSPATGELISLALSGETKSGDDVDKYDFSLDLGAEPSKSEKITGSASMTSAWEGETSVSGVNFAVDRANSDAKFERTLTLEYTETFDDVTDVLKYTVGFTNDKAAQTYNATVDSEFSYTYGDTEDSTKATLSAEGTLDYTETTLSATVGGMKFEEDGDEVFSVGDIGLTVSLSAGEEIGAMPEYTDVLSLGFEEIMDLYIELQDKADDLSDIGEKVSEFGESLPFSEDGFDFDLGFDFGSLFGGDGDGDENDLYYPDEVISLYNGFDEKFDYNADGKVDGDDRDEWDEYYRPYGETFDEEYDYDMDGKTNTDEDRADYENFRAMLSGDGTGAEFNSYYAEFNEEYDYDNDGKTGTDSDRADYEKYFKPFADEFDPDRDYDNDGVADGDDRDYYDSVRNH